MRTLSYPPLGYRTRKSIREQYPIHSAYLTAPEVITEPTEKDINNIRPANAIKCAPKSDDDENSCERFWVIVTHVREDSVIGIIDNNLEHTDRHWLSFGDSIEVPKESVIMIINKNPKKQN